MTRRDPFDIEAASRWIAEQSIDRRGMSVTGGDNITPRFWLGDQEISRIEFETRLAALTPPRRRWWQRKTAV